MSYARRTQVSEQRSRDEIEKILLRFGADGFGYFTANGQAMIGFTHQGLSFKLAVPLPDRDDPIFTQTPTGKARTRDAASKDWEAEVKRRWRSLCLVVKALLVGVEDGVLEFEQAFMPFIVLAGGETIYQNALPQITKALEAGRMPKSVLCLPSEP